MAQQLTCDICADEPAVQMLTNLATGDVLAIGGHCSVIFYGQSLLGIIGSDDHAGPPTKCQACRRIHERMTTPVAPLGATQPTGITDITDTDSGDETAATP